MKQDYKGETIWRGDWTLQEGLHLLSHHRSWGRESGRVCMGWGQDASNRLSLGPCSSARGPLMSCLLVISWSVCGLMVVLARQTFLQDACWGPGLCGGGDMSRCCSWQPFLLPRCSFFPPMPFSLPVALLLPGVCWDRVFDVLLKFSCFTLTLLHFPLFPCCLLR